MTLISLAGCASTPPAVLDRALPPAPAIMRPVPMPADRKGGNVYASRARALDALDEANGRLGASRDWYEAVRTDYAGQSRN